MNETPKQNTPIDGESIRLPEMRSLGTGPTVDVGTAAIPLTLEGKMTFIGGRERKGAELNFKNVIKNSTELNTPKKARKVIDEILKNQLLSDLQFKISNGTKEHLAEALSEYVGIIGSGHFDEYGAFNLDAIEKAKAIAYQKLILAILEVEFGGRNDWNQNQKKFLENLAIKFGLE